MSLPSSIWVKFKDDQIKVTYLGVEYTLTIQSVVDNEPYISAFISGNTTNGTAMVVGNDENFAGGAIQQIGNDVAVKVIPIVAGVSQEGTVVGSITWSDYAVTSVSGSITAATIIHRDSRLPKLLELPTSPDGEGTWELIIGVDVIRADLVGNALDPNTLDFFDYFSFTWDSATNVGTTDCPFVEWIGELTELDTFTVSGTWTLQTLTQISL